VNLPLVANLLAKSSVRCDFRLEYAVGEVVAPGFLPPATLVRPCTSAEWSTRIAGNDLE
jgi:hypothetical protein